MYCHIHHCHYHHCNCGPKDSKENGKALTQEELLAYTQEMKEELKDYTVDLKDQIFSYIDIGVNPVEIANTFASLKEQDTYILRTLTNKIDELNNTTNLSMFNLRTRVTDLEGQSAALIQDINSLPFEGGALADTFVTVTTNASGSVVRSQYDKNSETKTPQDFGAKGDGITDDTVAFTGLFANGGNIHIPNGTYMIDAVNIGKPKNGSTIRFDAKAVMKVIPNDAKYYEVIDLDGVEDVIIYDAQIIGDKYEHLPGVVGASQWGHGINLIGSKNIKIYNPKVSKCWGDGIYMRQVENVLIVDPVCDDNRRQGMSIISAKDLVVIRPILTNTSGQSPAYGLDMEVNWAGENFENVKIYNPVFRNNGKDGSYPAGMSVSLERASIPEKPALPTPPTLIDIEIFDPIFENNALILSTATNTFGTIKIHNPVINTTDRVALYLLEAISPDCYIELHNVVIKDAVAAEGTTVYDNPVNIESLTKNIGSQNILIDGLSISSAKYPRTNAVRVIQSEGATAPLKNVIIKDLKVSKDYTSHLNLSNGAMAITPDPTFRVEFSKDSMKESLAVNSNISSLLNRIRAKVISAAATYNEYLNADIPVSDVEFYLENRGTGMLSIRFGTSSALVKNYIYPLSNTLEDGLSLSSKGSWVKLKKIAEDAWEILDSSADVGLYTLRYRAAWNPPELAPTATQTHVVTVPGAKVGKSVYVSFSKPLLGSRIYGEVSAEDTVTVYHQNPLDVAVVVDSGDLRVVVS